jgi:hypothetical protein
MAQTPGFRIKVLANGLHQLASKCKKVSDELAAVAKPPSMPVSGWPSSATTAGVIAERAGNDVAAVVKHVDARAAWFNAAGAAITNSEAHSSDRLRRVGR